MLYTGYQLPDFEHFYQIKQRTSVHSTFKKDSHTQKIVSLSAHAKNPQPGSTGSPKVGPQPTRAPNKDMFTLVYRSAVETDRAEGERGPLEGGGGGGRRRQEEERGVSISTIFSP